MSDTNNIVLGKSLNFGRHRPHLARKTNPVKDSLHKLFDTYKSLCGTVYIVPFEDRDQHLIKKYHTDIFRCDKCYKIYLKSI